MERLWSGWEANPNYAHLNDPYNHVLGKHSWENVNITAKYFLISLQKKPSTHLPPVYKTISIS